MIEFTVKYATLNCICGFNDTFFSLPEPGDEYFSALYKNLSPYGIALSSITFEEDAETLGDERMVIPLLDGRLKLRLAYAGFDFVSTDWQDGDDLLSANILQAIFPIFKEMGADVEQAVVQFTYRGFVHLHEIDRDVFLRQHLKGQQDNTQLTPFAFVYQVALGTGSDSPIVRVHIARSLAPNYLTELFVELLWEYPVTGEIAKFTKQAMDDWHQAMASLDLKLCVTGGEDDASK
ncbi:MAG: hypothetical protein ACREA2_09235 [Blastocatellia bacterium]